VEKTAGKSLLGRPIRRWDYNIKQGLKEIGWQGLKWINLAQDRDKWQIIVNTAMNFRIL
jgi:hypothetical protein